MIKRHFHRRNLAHLHYNEGIYFVTYRLSGSIPQVELKELQIKMNNHSKEEQNQMFMEYDKLLDKNSPGLNYPTNPQIAEICWHSIFFLMAKTSMLLVII